MPVSNQFDGASLNVFQIHPLRIYGVEVVDLAVTPIAKQTQPLIKHSPPKGVTEPIQLKLSLPLALRNVSRYSEPQNTIIPAINKPAEILKVLEGLILYKIPAASNANTW